MFWYVTPIQLLKQRTFFFFGADFTSVRSTDFCQGEITSNKGDFIQLSDQPRNLTDELYWPQSIMGFSVASAPYCVTHDGLILRRRCLGDRSSGLYWESLNNTKVYFFFILIQIKLYCNISSNCLF